MSGTLFLAFGMCCNFNLSTSSLQKRELRDTSGVYELKDELNLVAYHAFRHNNMARNSQTKMKVILYKGKIDKLLHMASNFSYTLVMQGSLKQIAGASVVRCLSFCSFRSYNFKARIMKTLSDTVLMKCPT
jgi:hypothetical protein